MLINKKRRTGHVVDFAVPADGKMKVSKDRGILGLYQKTKKALRLEAYGDTNRSWRT